MCAYIIGLDDGIASICDLDQLKWAMKGRGEACCLSAGNQNVVLRCELVVVSGIALSLQLEESESMLLLALADVAVSRCVKALSFLCHVGDVRLWCKYAADH